MRFATDATLGKLGRHLRMAGFDTLCQHHNRSAASFWASLDAGRVILTRTKNVKARFHHRHLIFIRENEPLQQMRQVVVEAGIAQHDLRPLSRCLECNTSIHEVDRLAVRDRVPAYVWHCQQAFHECDQCRRIYWAGSHHNHMSTWLAAIFNNNEKRTHER